MHVALVDANGVLVNIIAADSVERAQEFYPDFTCVERDDDTSIDPGDIYKDGVWTRVEKPTLPRGPISKLAFLSLFTQEQRVAIRAARNTDAIVGDAMYMLDLADNVDLSHADTINFVNYMASAGFIGQDDAQRILS